MSREATESNSFSTKIAIPSGQKAEISLRYEYQLKREPSGYHYETKLKTFGLFDQIKVPLLKNITFSKNFTSSTNFILELLGKYNLFKIFR